MTDILEREMTPKDQTIIFIINYKKHTKFIDLILMMLFEFIINTFTPFHI
jgi:hypothetical protein